MDMEGNALRVGDSVMGRYRGGKKMLPGTITRIDRQPTTGGVSFVVDYDGDVEEGVVGDNLQFVDGSMAPAPAPAPAPAANPPAVAPRRPASARPASATAAEAEAPTAKPPIAVLPLAPATPMAGGMDVSARTAMGLSATSVAIPSLGRLCRELAGVRARARPALFDTYTAQARARAAAADAFFGAAIVPAPADVERWLVACLTHAATASRDPVFAADAELVGTIALRDGLVEAGFAVTRDALAVLRSAFRLRPEYVRDAPFASVSGADLSRLVSAAARSAPPPAAGAKDHAAVLVHPLATYLASEDTVAFNMLLRLDEFAQQRSGRPRPPTLLADGVPPGMTPGYGGGPLTATLGTMPWGAHTLTPGVMGTPMRPGVPGAMMTMSAAFGAASPGVFGGGSALTAAATLPPYGGTALGPPRTSAPVSTSVGDFLRLHATPREKENLLVLLQAIGDVETRSGVLQPPRSSMAAAEGGDSLVMNLGPRLRAGLRFYVE